MASFKNNLASLGGCFVALGIGIFSDDIAKAVALSGLTAGLGNMISGVTGNLLTDFLARFKTGVAENYFREHPDELNHDLQKALEEAIQNAVKNIEVLYNEAITDKEEKEQVKNFTKAVIANLPLYLKASVEGTDNEKEIKTYLQTDFEEAKIKLNNLLQFEVSQHNLNNEFTQFFDANILAQLKLCIAEALKSEKHHKGWIAFQKMILEDLQKDTRQILESQKRLEKGIQEIKESNALNKIIRLSNSEKASLQKLLEDLNHPQKLQVKFDKALDDLIGDVKRELIEINKKLERIDKHLVEDILHKGKLDETIRKKLVGRNLAMAVGMIFLLVVGIYCYIYTRPFSAVFSLQTTSFSVNKDYPSPTFPVAITFYLPGETKKMQVTDENELVLNQLPHTYQNKFVKLKINDPYWEEAVDSIKLSDSHTSIPLKPNEILGKISGEVRTRDGSSSIEGAAIKIGADTVIYSDKNGFFNTLLPDSMKRKEYLLTVEKNGYNSETQMYYPKSGNAQFRISKY